MLTSSTDLTVKLFVGGATKPMPFVLWLKGEGVAAKVTAIRDHGFDFHMHIAPAGRGLMLSVNNGHEDLFGILTASSDVEDVSKAFIGVINEAFKHVNHEVPGHSIDIASDATQPIPFLPFDTEGRD